VSLKISLKPQEKIFIGGAVVQNGEIGAEIRILNDVPLLREKDVIREEDANTPCQRIYLSVQLMYMDKTSLSIYQQNYCNLATEVLSAAPSAMTLLAEISHDLACGRYYQALKNAKILMKYEQELIEHAQRST
jgi:flagellar biosynthesis repressor protein FlbT